jgi:hypothetical protein
MSLCIRAERTHPGARRTTMPPPIPALAHALARALRAELDRPGRTHADDPESLITALAIVIAAQAPPPCPCRQPSP